MTSKYKILFMVEMLHSYYEDLKCEDFSILPSAATAELLKNQQMVVKVVENKLVVLVKVHADEDNPEVNEPFIPIHPNTRFLFYLDLRNTLFNTVTNLDTDKLAEKQRYYFSNLHQNNEGITLNLSKKIASFPTLQPYKPGDLVDNGTGQIFECIQSTGSANNTANANYWHPRGSTQLVSSQDMVQVVRKTSSFKVAEASRFAVEVKGFNPQNGLFDREMTIKNNLILTYPDTVKEVKVDLSELLPGRYKVKINTNEYEVWVDNDMVNHSFLGVIEIFSHLPSSSDFSFYDVLGKVKDSSGSWLKYTLHFANRLAYWKYMATRKGVASIDESDGYSFIPVPSVGTPKEYFTSNKPIPLQQQPWEFKANLSAIGFEPLVLPNPDPLNSGIFSRTEPEKNYFCTIYLNN